MLSHLKAHPPEPRKEGEKEKKGFFERLFTKKEGKEDQKLEVVPRAAVGDLGVVACGPKKSQHLLSTFRSRAILLIGIGVASHASLG